MCSQCGNAITPLLPGGEDLCVSQAASDNRLSTPPTLDLRSRLALRPKEAAEALGLSERKFRQIASRLPAVWVDSIRLYPVESLQSWLAEEADRQTRADAETADRILAELHGDEPS